MAFVNRAGDNQGMSLKTARELAGRALKTLHDDLERIPPGDQAIIYACLAQVHATLAVADAIEKRLTAVPGEEKGTLTDALEDLTPAAADLAWQARRIAGRHQDPP